MNPLRVLIIEDSEDSALLLLHTLRKGGYDPVYRRVQAEETMRAALQEESWDLILSDHDMPRFSAPAALAVLQEDGRDIPFIIVSGAIGEEMAAAVMKAGAHDFVMKRNLARLVPVVERELRDAENRRERRRAEEALRQREQEFKALAENAPDIIYRLQLLPEKKYQYVSPAVTEITGYTPEYYYADPNFDVTIIHPDDRELFKKIAWGEVNITAPTVLRWIHKDGRVIWVEQKHVPLFDSADNMIALEGLARDITSRILMEKELKEKYREIQVLSGRILNAYEEERTRLARELHDEIGQALTVINMDLQYLQMKLSPGERTLQEKIANSIQLLGLTLENVRRQIVALRPPSLDNMGLVEVVREMACELGRRAGLAIEVSEEGFTQRLPSEIETALYRCIQEALTNTVRHASAGKVSIELRRDAGSITAVFRDNGKGFDLEHLKRSCSGVGLAGIRERVNLLGGKLHINTATGQGVGIFITIPVSHVTAGGGHSL